MPWDTILFVYIGSLAASLASLQWMLIAPPSCDNQKYLDTLSWVVEWVNLQLRTTALHLSTNLQEMGWRYVLKDASSTRSAKFRIC